jgi:hypothetical protein
VLLLTKLLVKQSKNLPGRHFEEDFLGHIHNVLTTSYFAFNGKFYGKLKVWPWGRHFSGYN